MWTWAGWGTHAAWARRVWAAVGGGKTLGVRACGNGRAPRRPHLHRRQAGCLADGAVVPELLRPSACLPRGSRVWDAWQISSLNRTM